MATFDERAKAATEQFREFRVAAANQADKILTEVQALKTKVQNGEAITLETLTSLEAEAIATADLRERFQRVDDENADETVPSDENEADDEDNDEIVI